MRKLAANRCRQSWGSFKRPFRFDLPSAVLAPSGALIYRSTVTGRAYRVKCGDAEPVTSSTWFLARLRELRKP